MYIAHTYLFACLVDAASGLASPMIYGSQMRSWWGKASRNWETVYVLNSRIRFLVNIRWGESAGPTVNGVEQQ